MFVTCAQASTGAVFGITVRTGRVYRVGLNGANLIPYIVNTLRDNDLAIKVAGRLGLPGAEHLYTQQFEALMGAGQVKEAAQLVASSGSALRTPQTIARFQQIPAEPGAPQPVFQYFSTLLEHGKLNEQESIELAKPVLQQGRPQLMEKWLKDDKLHCSEALGDLIMPHDTAMALSVYLRSETHAKAIQCFVQRGEYDKIVPYSTSVGYSMDYSSMLSQLLFSNPQGALDLAKGLVSADGGPLIDIQATAEAFLSSNRVQETTAFLLEALKDNKEEHAYLQTKLLEINLIGGAPQVADAIMQNGILTHYDRAHIGKLCERAGMWQRAAEHYSDINDIKRVFKNSHQMNPEFVVTYFGKLNREQSIALLKDMMSRGPSNMQVCVEVAKKYNDELGSEELVKVFENAKATEGLYYYLGAVVNFSEDPVVHFKYIQSACMLGQFKEAERVCRDSNIYKPEQVKEYLKNAKLPDPRPLIHVCDRYDFVDELTEYLYLNSLLQYVEVYVTKVSPAKTPQVVGKLFDLGANEDFTKRILMAPWLEARVATGSTEPGTHNSLVVGKVLTKEEGEEGDIDAEKESQRRQLIDQVVEWALPESESADEVSCTNLLILTAIRADHTKVASYIDQLDNFDAKDIALICVSESHMLYEEAFTIYVKFAKPEHTTDKEEQIEMQVLAMGVLVDYMKDLDRAKTFANQVDEKPVWSKLGNAQLEEKMAADAILSFISAEDASEYVRVCAEANEAEIYAEVIPFLKMARKNLQENLLDTELIYAYAKTNNLTDLEKFVNGPNVANIQNIGDRCFSEGLYNASKILFKSINNNSKLALCHIHLEEYREAVAAASLANNVSTWKQVCFACLKASEFRLAATCGLEVIKYPDHVDDVVTTYSDLGHFDHLVSLFEQGLGLEDAHIGIFTELGILYTKHVPEKVMEHCKVFFSKLNVSKVVRACERARLFKPAVYLYMQDKQADSAVKTMSEHSSAFDNDLFLDAIVKVRNAEIMYKAVSFYLTMHPMLFTRLMEVLEDHVDHSRVVNQLRRTGDWALQLGQAYMKTVQKENLSAVNEALNELYIEDEDYESLRKSIDKFQNFNMIALASKLATHELLEFRRISAYVYRCNKKWSQSIELSKNDRMWKDCIDTANESADEETIEDLLRFFCETSEKECFCAALYTCFSHNMRQTYERLQVLEKRTQPPKEEDAQDQIAQTYGQLGGFGNGMLMLENGGGMGGMPGGMPGGMMPPGQGGIDMSGFGQAGMPNGMPPGGMMPNGMPGGMPPNMSM
ncbi:clathrin heavy chain [Skeletonema marinoi]|uniref:Clathrin heavy chain n=1 Tax=Skeletonema marinoi TaxID=267567 RepID=A0AAD9DA59_9STRA|nr:clathrin heavy chain [Skeletonema marinoi]